jgi:intracellular sulfur oxidation DsrE/DsrF family protein
LSDRRLHRVVVPAVLALAAGFLLSVASAEASHLADQPKKHRIVYQLNDPGVDKARFVLGNIQNHVSGLGWDHIEAVELVVFGPALRTFVTKDMDPAIKQALERLQTQGVTFGACGNTMKNLSVTLDQLPEGAKHLPQGGVVRLMELQEQGYINIRP